MNASIFTHCVLSQGNFRSFSKRTQNTFRVANHHREAFLLVLQILFFFLSIWEGEGEKRTADVPNFLWSFTIMEGGASSVD